MILKITTDKDYKVMNGKEWVKTISKYDSYITEVAPEAKNSAIKYFKRHINVKRMPKCFKIEEVVFPNDNKLHALRGNENMVYIVLNGKIVFEWPDDANTSWPEDLTWDREISCVFDSGVQLGIKLAKLAIEKV